VSTGASGHATVGRKSKFENVILIFDRRHVPAALHAWASPSTFCRRGVQRDCKLATVANFAGRDCRIFEACHSVESV